MLPVIGSSPSHRFFIQGKSVGFDQDKFHIQRHACPSDRTRIVRNLRCNQHDFQAPIRHRLYELSKPPPRDCAIVAPSKLIKGSITTTTLTRHQTLTTLSCFGGRLAKTMAQTGHSWGVQHFDRLILGHGKPSRRAGLTRGVRRAWHRIKGQGTPIQRAHPNCGCRFRTSLACHHIACVSGTKRPPLSVPEQWLRI